MHKNRSTKDLNLSDIEGFNLNKTLKPLSNFSFYRNFTSEYVKFYTFHVGFKNKKEDLLIAIFNKPSPVVAAYSKTTTPASPIIWDKKNNKGMCKILIINSGNANAYTGSKGIKAIDMYTKKASKFFQCSINQIMVSSTGIIGEILDYKKIIKAYPLIDHLKSKNLLSTAKAIMTTDTFPKIIIKEIKIGQNKIRIFGIAKGSGMIAPNMGTMLAYIFIEANISKSILKNFIHLHLDNSFNSISVDGDTSTNDNVMIFSLSGDKEKKITNKSYLKKLSKALKEVMFNLSLQVVCDGEGISKLMQINISNAKSYEQASSVAFAIANSPLVKTAIAGEDANWGRVIMAIGKTNSKIDQNKIILKFGKILVAYNGQKNNKIDIKKLDDYMKNKVIKINVDLSIGKFNRTVYASDLTHKYISINADYKS